jgi:benzodiazapine receptor
VVMKRSEVIKTVVICGVLLAIAGRESFVVRGGMEWYQTLQKPVFNPPSWLFGPVWTILYIMMGIAFALVCKIDAGSTLRKKAIVFFILQLVFNFLWTPIFFGLRQPLYAFADIVVLWLMVLATVWIFYRLSKLAAFLLVPYFLWISFAAALNLAICLLNK